MWIRTMFTMWRDGGYDPRQRLGGCHITVQHLERLTIVLTDPDLRADAEAYVRAFSRDLATRAGASDGPGILGRLTSDGGRAFMLLDAAVGDLA